MLLPSDVWTGKVDIKNTYPPMATRFAVSGCPQGFTQSAIKWLGYTPMVEQVCFADAVVS